MFVLDEEYVSKYIYNSPYKNGGETLVKCVFTEVNIAQGIKPYVTEKDAIDHLELACKWFSRHVIG